MTTRPEKREVINRKDLDPDCPCDKEVINILHGYGMKVNESDDQTIGAVVSFDTIKMIRKDVFKSHPDILNTGVFVEAEIVEEAEDNE